MLKFCQCSADLCSGYDVKVSALVLSFFTRRTKSSWV